MGVEQETRDFFIKIANSMAILLVWMIANVFFGLYLEWAFVKGSPNWKNIAYYGISVLTFVWLIRLVIRKWQ